jgi:hypothetical protein
MMDVVRQELVAAAYCFGAAASFCLMKASKVINDMRE